MSLGRIELQNFQTHKLLRLRFDDRVTCLVGKSDVGKSSILRALRWATLNRPRGDDMIRWDADAARVRLWFDGHRLTRQTGKGGNLYRLDGGAPFKAFGADVPAPISELLCVDELNFQSQHSAPFWFSLTPGDVSKALNRIVNLDAMDAALGRAAAGLRKAKADVELTEERLTKAKTERKALAWAKRASAALGALEAAQASLDALNAKRGALAGILARLREAQAAVRTVPSTESMDDCYMQLLETRRKRLLLEALVLRLRDAEEVKCKAKTRATETEAKLVKLTADRCPICGMGRTP